jgi:hypothetical protein
MERGSKRQVSHVFHGDENDQITVLKGTEADVADAFKDCKRRNRTFAIRHWIISPHEAMTREQLLAVVWMLCMEFGADYESAVIVEHDKPRVDPQACSRHLHVLVPENTIKGRVLDSRHSYARHEKIARVAEHDNGHRLLISPHHLAVIEALTAEGRHDVAGALKALTPTAAAGEAFSQAQQQQTARIGLDLAELRPLIQKLWRETEDRNGLEMGLQQLGLRVRPGDLKATYLVETEAGQFVGSLSRLARAKNADVKTRMEKPNDDTKPEKAHNPRSDSCEHAQPEISIGPASVVGAERHESQSAVADGPDARPTSANSDSDRTITAGERGPCSEGGRRSDRSRDQAGVAAVALTIGFAHRAERIIDLLGQARFLTLPQDVRVVSALDTVIEESQSALRSCELGLAPSARLVEARNERKNAERDLVKAQEQHDADKTKLTTFGQVSSPFFGWLTGAGAQRRQEQKSLASSEQASRKGVERATTALRRAEIRENIEERQFKLDASSYRQLWRGRAETARPRIKWAEMAKRFAIRNPSFARWGLNTLLKIGAIIQSTHEENSATMDTIDWTDIFGIPHPRFL